MKARIRPNLTAKENKAMEAEIMRQFAEYDKKHTTEIDALVLWVLREVFGFGKRRLKRFYDAFSVEIEKLVERYVMEDSDDVWLCTTKLKQIGIDLSEWEKEEENDSTQM